MQLKKYYIYFLSLIPITFGFYLLDPLFLFLALAMLIWAILSFLLPEYLALVLVFFYPWIGWDWSFHIEPGSFLYAFVGGSIELPLSDLAALLVFFGFAVNLFWRYYILKDKAWRLRLPAFFFFLGFIFAGYLSLNNSGAWYFVSIKYLLRPMAFFYLTFILPLYNLVKKPRQYYYLLYLMFAIGLIAVAMGAISLSGVFEHIHRAHPLAVFGRPFWGLNQNLLAEILVAAIPFSVILLFWEKRNKVKPYILLGIILMIVISLLTFSRTAWLALILGAILAMILLWREKKHWFLYWGLLALLAVIPLALSMWSYSFESYTARSSNWGRMEMTEFAYFLWEKHPLIGNGVGTYVYRLAEAPMYYEHLGTPFEAHGLLQKIGSEMGLLGLFFYFALIWALAWPLWRAYRQVKKYKDRVILVTAGLVVILSSFYQLFNTNYYSPKLWVPLTLAIILAKFYNEKTKSLEIEN